MTIKLPELRSNGHNPADDARAAAASILSDDTVRSTIRSLRDAASTALKDLPENLPDLSDLSLDRLPGRQRQSVVRRSAPTIVMVLVGIVAGLVAGIWMASAVSEDGNPGRASLKRMQDRPMGHQADHDIGDHDYAPQPPRSTPTDTPWSDAVPAPVTPVGA